VEDQPRIELPTQSSFRNETPFCYESFLTNVLAATKEVLNGTPDKLGESERGKLKSSPDEDVSSISFQRVSTVLPRGEDTPPGYLVATRQGAGTSQ
jgi:hypothetical protein